MIMDGTNAMNERDEATTTHLFVVCCCMAIARLRHSTGSSIEGTHRDLPWSARVCDRSHYSDWCRERHLVARACCPRSAEVVTMVTIPAPRMDPTRIHLHIITTGTI